MRLLWILLTLAVTGCATLETKPHDGRVGLTPRKLSPGDCGLFIWKADQSKTFILYADQEAGTGALYREGQEVALTSDKYNNQSTQRVFKDPDGQTIKLSLFDSEEVERGVRYKSGRLSSIDNDSWELIEPIVGVFTCQPVT